jgi:hypothetical protein
VSQSTDEPTITIPLREYEAMKARLAELEQRVGPYADIKRVTREIERERFAAYLKRAREHVDSMPEWKRNIFGSLGKPSVSVPRPAVDNFNGERD